MEAARSAGIVATLALALLVVPLATVAASQAEESSTPAEPVFEAKEPAVVSEPLPRGDVQHVGPPTAVDTDPISVDGNLSEWQAEPTRLGGTTILEAGELVYQGFVFDDHGADDGKDAQRIATLGEAYEREDRTHRGEALAQAAHEQFGAPDPTGGVLVSPAHYGNAEVPGELEGHADLLETRLTVRGDDAYLSARTAAMTDPSAPALLVLADTDPASEADAPRKVPFDSGIETTRAETALLITQQGVQEADLVAGGTSELASAEVAVNAFGYANAIEARVPLGAVAALAPAEGSDRIEIALGAGLYDGEGGLVDVATGEAQADVLDVAFRHEAQVSNWMDRGQALELLEGRMSHFTEAAVEDLASGTSYDWQPTPGYHERVFESSTNISTESDREGLYQHYGLYLPSDWEPGTESPLTFWLHWRGGTAHQAAAWTPRVFEQLGEEREPANVVVSPRARGTSTWYAGAGHLDVLQVYEDVHELLAVDEDRRYLSGYSMGGYGSYLFGLLYPDQFAAAYPISGAMTIGLWAGVDEEGRDTIGEDGGDGNLENTYRLVENARNLPYVIHHGTDDELVPLPGVQRMAAKFAQLGYEYRLYRFLGYEHFTQAALDQWTEGADYLDQHVRDPTPASVTYKRVPALEHAIETLNARGADIDLNTEGAYWVTDLQPRDASTTDPTAHGQIDATSHAIPDAHVTQPEAGAASTGHEGVYVMDGLAHASICAAEALCPQDTISNELDVELTNVEYAIISADGAQIDQTNAEATIRLSTDGDSALHVRGDWSCEDGTHEISGDGRLGVGDEFVTISTTGPADVTATICD